MEIQDGNDETGKPIMREENRGEKLHRIRAKYEAIANGGDAFLANNAREMLDVLDLLDGGGAQVDARLTALERPIAPTPSEPAKVGESYGSVTPQ